MHKQNETTASPDNSDHSSGAESTARNSGLVYLVGPRAANTNELVRSMFNGSSANS